VRSVCENRRDRVFALFPLTKPEVEHVQDADIVPHGIRATACFGLPKPLLHSTSRPLVSGSTVPCGGYIRFSQRIWYGSSVTGADVG
jgi:hypothetical protein